MGRKADRGRSDSVQKREKLAKSHVVDFVDKGESAGRDQVKSSHVMSAKNDEKK